MQVNDFKNIQEAIKYEVLQDEKEYLKLLKVIGNNQKYDFSSQLSITKKNLKLELVRLLICGRNILAELL